ncbi:MAG TPA: hypothetical protein PKD24_02835 [Pyrinomonadaceae bacterium]|nr:hypothetical protein [Pyrinomonadaceae bacterium]HMP64487.1 hypothetical protein [Pyrinomonadaceae bacterium]
MPTRPSSTLIARILAVVSFSLGFGSADAQTAGSAPALKPERLMSISEVTDVKPSDAYFLELQSLIERYGISGLTKDRKFDGAAPLGRPELDHLIGESRELLLELTLGVEIPIADVRKAFPVTCALGGTGMRFTELNIAEYLECSFGAGSVSSKKPTNAITTRGRFVIFLDAALSAAEKTVTELQTKAETAAHALRTAIAGRSEVASKAFELSNDPTDLWNYIPGTWAFEVKMSDGSVTRSHVKFATRAGEGFPVIIESRSIEPLSTRASVIRKPPVTPGGPPINSINFDYRGFKFEGRIIFSGALVGTFTYNSKPSGTWSAYRRPDLDYIDLAFMASDEKRNEDAITYFTKAIERLPFASYLLSRGNIYFEEKAFEKAIADYSRAYSIDSQYYQALINRSLAHSNLKNDKLVIADVDLLLTKHLAKLNAKDRSDLHLQRGLSRLNLGQRDAAIADFREALRLQPNSVAAKHQLTKLGLQK